MKFLLCSLVLFAVAFAAPSDPSGRIIGGTNAVRGAYPYIVSLQYCILTICQHSCGATIITPRWILTAAHCITELPAIGSLYVLAGVLNLNDDNIERQYVSITGYVIHPGYEGGVNPHDIAVIRLSSSLIFNSQVQQVQLPSQGEEPTGQTVLVGWGSTGGIILPQMPNTLQRVGVPIITIENCNIALNNILQGAPHPLHFESNVCSGPLDAAISACSGDSGGPLLQDGKILGIVSWGITPCGRVDAPTVYAKVSYYIDWIASNIDEPLLLNYSKN